MIKKALLVVFFCWFNQISCAQIEAILQDPKLKYASISITLLNMESGKEVFTFDPNRSLIPASTLKLLTGTAALKELGPKFRYTTEIAYDGEISSDKTLEGNLYIIGNGDPTLGSDRIKGNPDTQRLMQLISKKVKENISCIDGFIYLISHDPLKRFPIPRDWLYEDVGNYYGAGVWPLNINENKYDVFIDRTGKVGSKTRIQKISPFIAGLVHDNTVTVGTAGSGDQSYILGGPYQYKRRIVGTLPKGKGTFKIKGSIPDPPHYFALLIHEGFLLEGINHQGVQVKSSPPPKKRQSLTKIRSPRLIDIVQSVHLESNNLYTEALARTLVDRGLTGIQSFGKGSIIVDASGLSPMNRLSSRHLTSFLNDLGLPNQELLNTLPQSGKSGSLKSRFKQSPAKEKIYAKSGSMGGVLCYAGYIKKKKGWHCFAMMLNNFEGSVREVKPLADEVMEALFLME